MNKRTKTLIFSVVGLVVLIGLLLCVKLVTGNADNTDSGSVQSSYIKDVSEDEIKSVTISNEKSGYVPYTLENGDDGFSIPALDKYGRNADVFSNAVYVMSKLAYQKLLREDVSDLAEYGLDKPYSQVTVEYTDGSSISLDYGIEVPNSGGSRYMCLHGEDDVYIVPLSVNIGVSYPVTSFLSLEMLAPDTTGEKLTEVRLYGKNRPFTMVIRPNTETVNEGMSSFDYMLYEPCVTPVSVYEGEDVSIIQNTGITAFDVLEAEPDEETIASYGLDDPQYVLSYDFKGETVTLRFCILDATQATFAGMVEGKNVIYQLNHGEQPWVDSQLSDIAFKYIYRASVLQTQKLSITVAGDRTYDFSFTHGMDDDGNHTLVTDCNGADIPDAANMRNFFQVINYVRWTGTVDESFEKTAPALSVRLSFLPETGMDDDVINYYKISDRKYAIEINGETYFYTSSTYINKLISDIDNVLSGTTVVTDY